MAPKSMKFAATALLAAASAMGANAIVEVRQGADIAPEALAKAIIRKMNSDGGFVHYTGNAEIYGMSPTGSTAVNVERQFSYFSEADSTLLSDGLGEGVAIGTLPIEAVFTGTKVLFNPLVSANLPQNLAANPLLVEIEPYTPGIAYYNYVVFEFEAEVPAGELTVDYAFCTSRENIGGSSQDLFTATIEGVNVVFGEANMALLSNGDDITPTTVNDLNPANWVTAAAVGLPTIINRCLRSAQATTTIADSGIYRFRFSTSQQGGFVGNTAANSQPTWSFLSAQVVTTEPESFNPNVGLMTGQGAVDGVVDTWCIQANGNTNDFAPGYRFDTVEDGAKVCCRLKGKLNGDSTVCQVGHCEGGTDDYSDFIADPADAPVCYAQCLSPAAYLGDAPLLNLAPNIEGLWDDRVDPTLPYTGAPIITATFADPSGANRRWVVAFDDFQSFTGVALDVSGTTYVCRTRGVIDNTGGCLIGCTSFEQDFLSIGDTEGSRCFHSCYFQPV